MKFILHHWQGKLPMWISLWVIFIGLILLLSVIEPLLLKTSFPKIEDRITPTLVSLILSRLIIYPWQLIGLLRATDKNYIAHGNTLKTRSIQALMILSTLFTMVYSIDLIQNVISSRNQNKLALQQETPANYTLKVQNNKHQLLLDGVLEIGVTQATKEIIEKHPELTSVKLNSIGGQIYEGRGLSKLFSKYQLDTYVFKECSSACATAFIGGKHRYLGEFGKLGFHQYKLDTTRFPKAVPFHVYDLSQEQSRDLELFKSQGIHQQFLDKVFDQTADGVWFPNHSELIKAGVIHAVSE